MQSTSMKILLIFGEGLYFPRERGKKRADSEVGLMNVLMVAF